MALTIEYRMAIRSRKRKWRRFEVIFFFFLTAIGLIAGSAPLTWSTFGSHMMPYVVVITRVFMMWKAQQVVKVGSLDDRAMTEYGVEFERTTASQQRDLLDHYRVGTYPLNAYADEYEEAKERECHWRAYNVLRVLLPALAVLYWLGWRLLPDGSVRTAWTNGPVVFTWTIILILAMPQIIRMWTEPDDPNPAEPKLVEAVQKEV